MSVEIVKNYFDANHINKEILEFPVSSATVELAAQAAGVEPARIAKTLSFYTKEKDGGHPDCHCRRYENRQQQVQTFLRNEGKNACAGRCGIPDRTRHRRCMSLWKSGYCKKYILTFL